MNFYVGQKVVCVDDEWYGGAYSERGLRCPLVRNRIYTIQRLEPMFGIFRGVKSSGQIGLVLVGVRKPRLRGVMGNDAFHPARFRPVVERKTDISIFKAMLNPSKEMETTTALESRLVIRG